MEKQKLGIISFKNDNKNTYLYKKLNCSIQCPIQSKDQQDLLSLIQFRFIWVYFSLFCLNIK